jgi:hypothetical protein
MSDFMMMSRRIGHPRIDPADITVAVRVEPPHRRRVGETRRDSVGADAGDAHRSGKKLRARTR